MCGKNMMVLLSSLIDIRVSPAYHNCSLSLSLSLSPPSPSLLSPSPSSPLPFFPCLSLIQAVRKLIKAYCCKAKLYYQASKKQYNNNIIIYNNIMLLIHTHRLFNFLIDSYNNLEASRA